MAVMSMDVARIRGLYPTVGGGTAHLDGPFNALLPESVIRAIIATLRSTPAQPGSRSAGSQRSATTVLNARRAVADLVGAAPDAVVLGASLAALTHRFALLLARTWQLGDEIVLSRLDSDDTIRPWLSAARAAGAILRWAEVDVETGELPTWQYEHLVNSRTRVVTVPLGNPTTGVVPDVEAIADLAHRYNAHVIVDVGAAIPHLAVDLLGSGADILGVSMGPLGGPTVAALATRLGLLEEIEGETHRPIPQRFEYGPLPVELLGGLTAVVDHLADLDEYATGSRRDRVAASLHAAGEHTTALYRRLDDGLRATKGVTVLGSSRDRLPVVAFTVARHAPTQVGDALARDNVSVWTGPSGMSQFMRAVGVDEVGGAVHVGLMPHSTDAEVDRLLDGLRTLTRQPH